MKVHFCVLFIFQMYVQNEPVVLAEERFNAKLGWFLIFNNYVLF